ncbi:hypothetical protein Y032_0155g3051 [Ancylostoma ceylanicum]|uniref:Uncharacterized protein n=1 Tax=Ancylostoma ceylanicum TaxID=53326 RepID=A0A016SZT6_9BILA|nr:hypothetical protein Y032_0155g3051 [Ancylostoma ceylanicum]
MGCALPYVVFNADPESVAQISCRVPYSELFLFLFAQMQCNVLLYRPHAMLGCCFSVLKILSAPRGNKGLTSVLQLQPPYPDLSSYMGTILKVSD